MNDREKRRASVSVTVSQTINPTPGQGKTLARKIRGKDREKGKPYWTMTIFVGQKWYNIDHFLWFE